MRGLGLTWNPAWDHEGLSAWAVAQKIAHVTWVRPEQVLQGLTGASRLQRLPVWADNGVGSRNLASVLGLNPTTVAQNRFVGPAHMQRLGERERYRLGLRFCPECLRDWYHTARFQDSRVLRCPWHGCRLCSCCLECGRHIDPLGFDPESTEQVAQAPPWHCTACRKPLGPVPDEKWLTAFKRRPSHDGVWPTTLPASHLAYSEVEEGRADHRVLYYDREFNVALAGTYSALFFEEGAALWDTVLSRHLACVEAEYVGASSQGQFHVHFKCPVAGAVLTVLSALGVSCEARGHWPTWRKQGTHLQDFDRTFRQLPGWQASTVAGELVKHYMHDALMLYADVASAGKREAMWWLPPELDPKNVLQVGSSKSGVFAALVRETQLVLAVKRAALYCPNQRQQR